MAVKVLNLIITGIPSILYNATYNDEDSNVLNLIITGIPSIRKRNKWIKRKYKF